MARLKQRSKGVAAQEASRLLSAAEFLLSIPCGTQPLLSNATGKHSTAAPDLRSPTAAATPAPSASPNGPTAAAYADQTGDVSVRLRGDRFRHITSRGSRWSSAFADALLRERVPDGRVVFSSSRTFPSAITSLIRYDPQVEAAKAKEKQLAAARLLFDTPDLAADSSAPRWRVGKSYAHLLRPEAMVRVTVYNGRGRRLVDEADNAGDPGYVRRYDPFGLDDASFDRLSSRLSYEREGFVLSVLPFRDAQQAKQETNFRFAQAFPWLDMGEHQSLTLSKIRSLKVVALNVWWGAGWELSTVALACVALERLVWMRLVTKANRRLAMATCLLLAFKHNEATGEGDGRVPPVKTVVSHLESSFRVSRAEMLRAEFPVFVHLGFSLHAPEAHVAPHMDRLLTLKGTSLTEYMSQLS